MKSWSLVSMGALVLAGHAQAANVIPQSLINVSGVIFSVTDNVSFDEPGRDLNSQIDWFVFDVRPTQTEDTIFDFTRLSRPTKLSVTVRPERPPRDQQHHRRDRQRPDRATAVPRHGDIGGWCTWRPHE